MRRTHGFEEWLVLTTATAMAATTLAGCSGAGGSGGGDGTSGSGGGAVNVLLVNNPQMVDLQSSRTPTSCQSHRHQGEPPVLPENDVRDKISQGSQLRAGQYDVASLSNFGSRSMPRTAGSPT